MVRAEADTMAAGARAAAELLGRTRPPTAIVAVSDVLAVGVLRQLTVMGLRPGQDVAVTGFDDSFLASAVLPGLTSVRQPIPEIAETLVRSLDRTDTAASGVLLRGRIVSRASAPVPLGRTS